MTDIVTDLSQTSLATAVKANLYAFFHWMRHSAAANVHDSPHGFNWRTNIAHPWFNGMLSTLPPTTDASLIIDETVNSFQAQTREQTAVYIYRGVRNGKLEFREASEAELTQLFGPYELADLLEADRLERIFTEVTFIE